ncbi:MAG: protein-disulfide reductase DsbD domain-containing protein, partial [Thermoanaerobaculia bacterium]
MTIVRSALVLLLAVAPVLARADVARTPHVTAELIAERTSVAPGETISVGLRLQMIEGWHTYWLYPGDSGEPTSIDWVLPAGFSAGGIEWPHPRQISMAPLTTYGYLGEVLLPVAITAAADAKPGTTAKLEANVFWMVCHEVCIPEEAKLSLGIPITATPGALDPDHRELFDRTRSMIPAQDPSWRAAATKSATGFTLTITPPASGSVDVEALRFFAAEGPVIEHSAPQKPVLRDDRITIELARNPYLSGDPKRLRGVLVGNGPLSADGARAVELDAVLGAPIVATAAPPATKKPITLWLAVGLAFVGGVILNLMPCVFPVVSLKVLGFVESAGHEPRRVRLHGLSFAAGVVVAFWLLAGLLLMLRAAGEEIGWGFQLQSPPFVAAMAFLIFAIGLVLAGVM